MRFGQCLKSKDDGMPTVAVSDTVSVRTMVEVVVAGATKQEQALLTRSTSYFDT